MRLAEKLDWNGLITASTFETILVLLNCAFSSQSPTISILLPSQPEHCYNSKYRCILLQELNQKKWSFKTI
jgi:hypothetical protein